MKKYSSPDSTIHVLARALIVQGNSVLICKHKEHYFLPGGHVENGESLLVALRREFMEELGEFKYSNPEQIGVCENIFIEKNDSTQHEINHIFITEVDSKVQFESKESFLSFEQIKITDLERVDILPKHLKPVLIKWFEDRKPFFVGMDILE